MKKIPVTILIILLLTSCMPPQTKPSYSEKVQVNVYDNSRWELGVGSGNANQFITESVPKGQTVNNLNEIITLQFYSKNIDNHSIRLHLKEKEALLTGICSKVNFQILSETNIEAMYQWILIDCKGHDDQFEVARYIKTENGIHRISYAQKNSNPSQEDFDKWLYIVREARVVNNP